MMQDRKTGTGGRERRGLMRHPTTMPVVCRGRGRSNPGQSNLLNASFGGLSFVSAGLFAQGDTVDVSFPARQITERFIGVVVWSQDLAGGHADRHAYGVRFCGAEMFRRVRLLEQICHIEAYRKVQASQHNRELSPNQVAEEWITSYAARFAG